MKKIENLMADNAALFSGKSYSHLLGDFMQAFGQLPANNPDMIPSETINLAKQLVEEEVDREFWPAFERFSKQQSLENSTELLDAIADSIYVLLWTAIAFKLPIHAAFLEVHRSNMAKVQPDGTVKKNEYGKVQKPPSWTPPDLFGIMMHHRDLLASVEWRGGIRNK